jgi:Mn2+/Fe2+ NRAMP family transporter
LLLIGADRRIMGDHASGKLVNALGGFYFVLVTLAALAALPLFILTHGGQR